MNDKQLRRLTWFLAELKANRYPNAATLAQHMCRLQDEEDFSKRKTVSLATSTKTAQRDIRTLIEKLGAPLEYCGDRHGYRLVDNYWQFKGMILNRDTLFMALLCCQVSKPLLPAALTDEVDAVRSIQLAAGEPGDMDLKMFESVVIAAGLNVPLAEQTTAVILEAWKSRRRLRLRYQSLADRQPLQREIDIQVLFLAGGVWYARAYCHLRQALRSFALHRILEPVILEPTYTRDTSIIEAVRNGRFFDQAMCQNVRVRVAPERVVYALERAWFPNQQVEPQADGSVIFAFPSVPQEDLILWVLSFRGALQLLAPASIRSVIRDYGQALVAGHAE